MLKTQINTDGEGNVQMRRGLLHSTSSENLKMRRQDRSKRKNPPKPSTLQLVQVLGLTLQSNKSLSLHPSKDLVVYPTGCSVVVYDWKKHLQLQFLLAKSENREVPETNLTSLNTLNVNGNNTKEPTNIVPKPVVSTAYSICGKFLAVGESGHLPRILIFDLESEKFVQELNGHKFGILDLLFSTDNKYLVSMGYQHDGVLNLWNWRTGVRLASNRISSKVNAMAFSSDGSYFVTVGLRHVRYWYLRGQSVANSNTQVLEGRSAVLGDLRSSNFVDVVASDNMIYALTSTGTLCQLDSGRKLLRFVDLKVKSASSLTSYDDRIIIGCSDGIVRMFTTKNNVIKYLTTLPKPHPLGVDVAKHVGTQVTIDNLKEELTFPDLIACGINFNGTRVITIYADRSLYVWDITDLTKVAKVRSCIYHSDSIWSSNFMEQSKFQFATGSSDGTVRFWDLDPTNATKSKNLFSKELTKIVYVEKDAVLRYHHPNLEPNETLEPDSLTGSAKDKLKEVASINELTTGVRSLKFTADGKYLVTGDRCGNLRVHKIPDYSLVTYQEAHDGEILDLDVLTIPTTDDDLDGPTYAIASASRDRLVHLFALSGNSFKLTQTLDDHSSSITAVNFFDNGTKLVTGSADKSCIFRTCQTNTSLPYFSQYFNHCGRATVFDMDLDSLGNSLVTVTNDKKINTFDLNTGKLSNSVKPTTTESNNTLDTSLSRVSLDRSGQYAALAATDKSLRIIDLNSNQILSTNYAHSEMVTSIKFSPDCNFLISTGGDGLICVYKVLPQLAAQMRSKLTKLLRPMDSLLMDGKCNTVVDKLKSNTPPRPRASSFDLSATSKSPQPSRKELSIELEKSNSVGSTNLTFSQQSHSGLMHSPTIQSPSSSPFGSALGLTSSSFHDAEPAQLDELEESIILDHTDQLSDTINTHEVIETNQNNSTNLDFELDDEMEPSPLPSTLPEIDEESGNTTLTTDQTLENYLNRPVPPSPQTNHRRSLSSKFMAFNTIKLVTKLKSRIPARSNLNSENGTETKTEDIHEKLDVFDKDNSLMVKQDQFVGNLSTRVNKEHRINLLGHRLRKSRSQQDIKLDLETLLPAPATANQQNANLDPVNPTEVQVEFSNLCQELEQVKDALQHIHSQFLGMESKLNTNQKDTFNRLMGKLSEKGNKEKKMNDLLETYSQKLLNLVEQKLKL